MPVASSMIAMGTVGPLLAKSMTASTLTSAGTKTVGGAFAVKAASLAAKGAIAKAGGTGTSLTSEVVNSGSRHVAPHFTSAAVKAGATNVANTQPPGLQQMHSTHPGNSHIGHLHSSGHHGQNIPTDDPHSASTGSYNPDFNNSNPIGSNAPSGGAGESGGHHTAVYTILGLMALRMACSRLCAGTRKEEPQKKLAKRVCRWSKEEEIHMQEQEDMIKPHHILRKRKGKRGLLSSSKITDQASSHGDSDTTASTGSRDTSEDGVFVIRRNMIHSKSQKFL